jgi:DNA-binding YbaB/EbfC family protein
VSDEFDLQSLLAQAGEITQRLSAAQSETADETFEGSSGGGKVKITLTGTGDVQTVRIDPSVVDPDEVDLLEDLIVAAFHDAGSKLGEWAQQQMVAGMGAFGGLGDLFGGGGPLGDLLGGGGLGALFGGGGATEELGDGEAIEAASSEAPPSED